MTKQVFLQSLSDQQQMMLRSLLNELEQYKKADSETKIFNAIFDTYPNGKLRKIEEYLDGIPNGKFIQWYENGNKQWDKSFKEGKFHGRSIGWLEDGRKSWEVYYINGEIINF